MRPGKVKYVIRAATASDAEGVARVRAAGWRHAYAELVPRSYLDAMDPAAWADGMRDSFARGGAPAHLVADAGPGPDGGVAGWASFGPYRPDPALDGPAPDPDGGGWGELRALYIRPSLIGTGLGRALCATALHGLETRGHHRVRLWVLTGNARARRFYARAGFTPDPAATRTFTVAGEPVEEIRCSRP
ncbi:GNAT family N-acetyltransferase [Streptomyces sp. RFCAC02]|uniref:GNAT family N-acetyltransferase n=1 Tax=Streptomyces sp. RFCAC02 TaxID=2499143 RepID=UPI001020BC0C|nr:GNAT family N-acetyltransferase [Streptomyces sp. RFCAC02]